MDCLFHWLWVVFNDGLIGSPWSFHDGILFVTIEPRFVVVKRYRFDHNFNYFQRFTRSNQIFLVATESHTGMLCNDHSVIDTKCSKISIINW
ncbi:Transcriptional regulator sdnM [Dirofilaria immitis]